jgi:hypothetical protein
MNLLIKNKKKTLLFLLLIVDACIFTLVNPHQAPSLVIEGAYLLVVITFYLLLAQFLKLVGKLIGLPLYTQKKLTLIATVCAAVLIGMQSIGQLALRDLLAIIPLVIVLYFYLSYYGNQKREE